MLKTERDDIYILNEHSEITETHVSKLLKENVYNNGKDWQRFLRYLFISLGVSFMVSGIIFFFAYNWADLNKFVKIGMIEGLIIMSTLSLLLPKINPIVKNIILSGISVLVGVLFAVFGQVYQTGANAYDFFLGWTLFITLWVIVSNFAPLWTIYLILLNIGFHLFKDQVANNMSDLDEFTSLFILNLSFLVAAIVLSESKLHYKIPSWFKTTISVAVVSWATFGICYGILDDQSTMFYILIFLTSISYTAGVFYAIKSKQGFYLTIIPFSLVFIISVWLLKTSHEVWMFLLICIFIIASITITIKYQFDLQKKWKN